MHVLKRKLGKHSKAKIPPKKQKNQNQNQKLKIINKMKTQPTGWENIVINDTSDKGLISKI